MSDISTATGRVVRIDPRTDPRWAQLATGHGTLFTSPPWITAVCGTYDFTPTARVVLDPSGSAGAPLGGFAWVEIDDVRGRRLSSLPFSDWADPPLADPGTWWAVSGDAFATGLPLQLRCRHDSPAADDPRLSRAGELAWHVTALDAPAEEIFTRLHAGARRNVRLARRHGVRVEVDTGLDALRGFHRLHVALRKDKYRLLAQPVELLERIWSEFDDDDVVTVTARLDGSAVAAAVYLAWGGVLHYKFGASLGARLAAHPNEAVHWAGIAHAVERGAAALDWGVSDLDQPGLVAYKRKWATAEGRVTVLRSAAAAPAPAVAEQAGRMLGELTSLLTDPSVPDEITARAGALLYRHFC